VTSSIELVRAYVQACLVDREALARYQEHNDPLMALQTLKQAFTTDVAPILAVARHRAGGAIDPIATFRSSGYRAARIAERSSAVRLGAGIV
jgi:L-rhamnose isomerase/sugar isomerase